MHNAEAISAASVAQAGSLPYRRLIIREPAEQTDAPPTASRRDDRLTTCATTGARSIAPPVGLRTFARSNAPRSQEVCTATPATANSAAVAQAGSLPYRGLMIREPAEQTDALPTASRRDGRLTICATTGARSIAPPVGLRTFARSNAPRSQEVCTATPATAAAACAVAQAGSLPYRGLIIREPAEQTDAPPTTSRRDDRLAICATTGARSIAPPVGLRTFARSNAPRSQEVCTATPATANSGAVAQAGSLPYRGLIIREPAEQTDALPTASRRDDRLTICATTGARSIAPPVGLRTFARSDAPRSQEVCTATPATANSGAVAQAGSLPYRGLPIRQPFTQPWRQRFFN
jgi:hypothetical protein